MPGSPRKDQRIASETITMRSRPSRNQASQTRSWVRKGSVVVNRVMNHFVAYDEVETISRFWVSVTC